MLRASTRDQSATFVGCAQDKVGAPLPCEEADGLVGGVAEDLAQAVNRDGFGNMCVAPADGLSFQQRVIDGFFGGVHNGFEQRGEPIFTEQ